MCDDKSTQAGGPDDEQVNGRRSESPIRELQAQIKAQQEQLDKHQAMIEQMHKALMGNGGEGMREMLEQIKADLAGIPDVIKNLGAILETLHHDGQMQSEVIERLLSKLKLEDLLAAAVSTLQVYRVAATLSEDAK